MSEPSTFYQNSTQYAMCDRNTIAGDRAAFCLEALNSRGCRYKRWLETISQIVWVANDRGEAVYVNPRWMEYTGLPASASLDERASQVVHPEDRDRTQRQWQQAVREGKSYGERVRLRGADGSYCPFFVRAEPVTDTAGKVVEWVGTCTQIDKLEQIEAELQGERQFLQALLQNLSDGIVACDRAGNLTLFNPAAQELHGIPQEPVPPEAWVEHYDLYQPDGKTPMPLTEVPLYQAFQGESVQGKEIVIAPKLKPPRTVMVNGDPIFSPDGEKLGAVVAMRDITEQQAALRERDRVEAALRLREAQLEEAQRIAHLGSWEFDVGTQQIFWSEELFRIFGMAPGQPEPTLAEHLQQFHPEDRPTFKRIVGQAIAEGSSYSFDLRVLHPDGTLRYIEARGRAICDETGKTIRLFGTVLDITRRKQAEAEIVHLNRELTQKVTEQSARLRTVHQLYRSVLKSIEEVIFQTDLDGYWIFLSASWRKITGFSSKTSLYTCCLDYVFAEGDRVELAALLQSLLTGDRDMFHYQFRSLTKEGDFRWLEMHAQPHYDGNGVLVGTSGALRDITDRKQTEAILQARADELARQRQQIERQNQQLLEASQLKSQFLATMSHELRTPMNAIMGFSQMLLLQQYGSLTAKQEDMVERILNNSQNLLVMVNEVLDFSRLEAGAIELNLEELDIANLVRLTVEELRSLATRKQLPLEVQVHLSNPRLRSDRSCLRRILVNLLSNAIKFTESGTVWVEVWDLSEERVAIAVKDTGIGIPNEHLTAIFEAFRQLDQTLTRRHMGTGLGLAITKSLVDILQGTISVTSQVGSGSTFQVALPRYTQPLQETAVT